MAASPSDAAGIAIAVAAADLEGCANPYCTETAKPKLNPFCSIGCGQFYWYNQSLLLRAQEDGQLDQSGGAFVRQGGSGGSGNSHDHSCDRACGRSRSHSHDADMTSMPDMTMAFQTKDPWRPMAVPDCPLIPLDEVQEEEDDQEEEDQEEEEKMYESPWSDDDVPHYSTATMDLNDLAAVQKELDESPPDSNFHKLIKRRPASCKLMRGQCTTNLVRAQKKHRTEPRRSKKQNAIILGNWSEFMVMRRLTTSKERINRLFILSFCNSKDYNL